MPDVVEVLSAFSSEQFSLLLLLWPDANKTAGSLHDLAERPTRSLFSPTKLGINLLPGFQLASLRNHSDASFCPPGICSWAGFKHAEHGSDSFQTPVLDVATGSGEMGCLRCKTTQLPFALEGAVGSCRPGRRKKQRNLSFH